MTRKLSPPDAARRRFLVVQTAVMAVFALAILIAGMLLPRVENEAQRWLLAAAPLPVLGLWAWEFFKVIRDDDEMMHAHYVRVVAISGMLVLLGASMWSILDRLLGVEPFPGFLLLPAFAIVYGVVDFVMQRRG